MGKKGAVSLSLADCFRNLEVTQQTLVQLDKWQLWTLAFHIVAVKEGLDCVEMQSEEQKAEERKEAMLVKVKLPSDWLNSNRVVAKMTYVHASDTSRFFVFSFQERQGNKIEVKIEKIKKVPGLMDGSPASISKFILMGDGDFDLEHFQNFDAAPWSPACPQIATFKEFITKEVVTAVAAQQASNNAPQYLQQPSILLTGNSQPSINAGRPIAPYAAPDQIPTSAVIGGGGQPNPYFSTGNPLQIGNPRIIGDPTMPGGHNNPGGFGGGGMPGNLVGPNSGIFSGQQPPMMGGGSRLGPFPPGGGVPLNGGDPLLMGQGQMGPGGLFFGPDGGPDDLHPQFPDMNNPMGRGGPRRFGPGGNPMGGGFGGFGGGPGGGGMGGPGGNMFM